MKITQRIRTAGDIVADEQKTDDDSTTTPEDESTDSPSSDSGSASATSLPAGAGSGSDARTPSGVTRPPWPVLAVLLVGLVAAAVGSWLWWSAAHDDDLELAQTRDTVLIEGTQHIETLNTLDYRDVDGGLEAWADATTGTMRDQLTAVDEAQRQLLADQQKISEGRVVEAGVLELDGDTATVVAAVEISVVDDANPGSEATVKRQRYSADLRLVKGEWKLENLVQVAVSVQ
jgi:Mce-associated membrane protein